MIHHDCLKKQLFFKKIVFNCGYTLSAEKIPEVLRPIIQLPVKSMASLGTRELSILTRS